MEEPDFLHELCLAALYSNRLVRFAAVLDNNGRLIKCLDLTPVLLCRIFHAAKPTNVANAEIENK